MNLHPRPRKGTTRGFTLIEIAVVLVLVALLASAIAVSASGMIRGATLEETIAQIESLDREARQTAQRLSAPVELHINRETKQFILRAPDTPGEPPLSSLVLSRRFELAQAWRLVQGEPQDDETLVVRYEPDGTATTWGLTISDRNTQDDLASVVILGMTGQMTQWEDHEQAKDILAEALGRHAD